MEGATTVGTMPDAATAVWATAVGAMPDMATANRATPDGDGETRALAASEIGNDATRVRPPGRM
jgi:hypothetical protein